MWWGFFPYNIHTLKASLSKIFSATKTGHNVLVAVTLIIIITKDEKWGKKK